MESLLVSILSSAPRARHVGRGGNLQHCALFYLGRVESGAGGGMFSRCQKSRKPNEAKLRAERSDRGRGGGEKKNGKKRESNERWERVCKEKRKTLSKSWSCFRKKIGGGGRGGGEWGSGGCHRGVPDGQAVSSQGVIVGGGGEEERGGGRRGVVREPGR